jgi:hypothetical protein
LNKIKIITAILISVFLLAFTNADKDPRGSKTNIKSKKTIETRHDYYSPTGSVVYSNNLDSLNDSTGLANSGFLIYNRGTNQPGIAPTWFTGNPDEFTAFNGPTNGYTASNFNTVFGTSNIDNWLVFPLILPNGLYQGDSLFFYARSVDGSTFPDSMRVMYSTADSIPEGNWAELGRFKVSTSGWELKIFSAPASSPTGRFAIRYAVANGGPTGQNSDYIGIDAIMITSNGPIGISRNEINVKFSLDQNYSNPFAQITNIRFNLKTPDVVTLKIYDITGRIISTLVNGKLNAGEHNVTFNAMQLPSGIYFYKLTAGDIVQVRKMTIIK